MNAENNVLNHDEEKKTLMNATEWIDAALCDAIWFVARIQMEDAYIRESYSIKVSLIA